MRHQMLDDSVTPGDLPCSGQLGRMTLAVIEAERMNRVTLAGCEGEKGGRIEATTEQNTALLRSMPINISLPRAPT
jgi:hypothetical protein